jgi:hypothetical protein
MGIVTDVNFVGTCSKCGGNVNMVIQYKGTHDEYVSAITVDPHICKKK